MKSRQAMLPYLTFGVLVLPGICRAAELQAEVKQQGQRIQHLETRVSKLEGEQPENLEGTSSNDQPRATPRIHLVKLHESLWSIGKFYGTSVAALKDKNALKSNVLSVGQRLQIPGQPLKTADSEPPVKNSSDTTTQRTSPTTHRIKSGETLSAIASRYGVSTRKLQTFNNLQSVDKIRAGHTLNIPTDSASNSNNPDLAHKPPSDPPATLPKVSSTLDTNGYPHQLSAGETIYGLSRKYGVSETSIMTRNGITDATKISPGSTLIIPGVPTAGELTPPKPTSTQPQPPQQEESPPELKPHPEVMKTVNYMVSPGETAQSIASSLGIPISRLLQINALSAESQIAPGSTIRVPEDALDDSLGSPF